MSEATGPTYRVPFRRRHEKLTNYRKRLALVKGGLARLVVRKSLQHVSAQFIQFNSKGDRVVASANSGELKKFGWMPQSNLPSAYLTGMLAAKKAKAGGISEFVLDIGLSTATKSALPFAALKGAADAGLKTSASLEQADAARIRGEHIAQWAQQCKGKDYDKRFSRYLKAGIHPEKLPEKFEEVKKAIIGGK